MSGTRPEQIAVFLDFENLVIGAERAMPGLKQHAVPYEALDRLTRERGSATVRRAYADWANPQFGKYQEDLGMNGVDLVQVSRFGAVQKNAADIRMAVDAMETLMTHPDIQLYVLVAGDGDYSPLVQRLREFGKTVIGVGTEASASQRLVAVCSEYKFWGTFVALVQPPKVGQPRPVFEVNPALVLALRVLDGLEGDADGWVPIAGLKSRMLQIDAAFDNANYGARTFTAFLELPLLAKHLEMRRGDLRVDVRRKRPRVAKARPAV